MKEDHVNQGGQKYFVNIEGKEFPWGDETITAEEIAQLGGWDLSQGIVEVDEENNERTINASEVIAIKPGHGYGKKHTWKRG
ncbi:MAG: hypothetical protein A2X79_00755 [Desulfuromonadaceae bacterium GWB2_53_15]|nr:MAG: hypothetical protein A2X79_00755 [Desulfuromonadaceae bacterium GWB2_53_15]